MPTPTKRKAAKKPTRKKKKGGRKKARKKARPSPTNKTKAARAKKRRAGKKKARVEADLGRPHSSLLAEKTIPESKPGAGDGVPSFEDKYLEAISLGMRKKERAHYAGCDPSTPREWMELALEDFEAGRETAYTRFYIKVKQAETERIAEGLKTIRTARMAGDWRAAAWELERSGYGAPPKQVALSGSLQTGTFPTDDQDDEIASSVSRDDEG